MFKKLLHPPVKSALTQSHLELASLQDDSVGLAILLYFSARVGHFKFLFPHFLSD